MSITHATVCALIEYDPESGRLFWKNRSTEFFRGADRSSTWNTRFAGKEITSKNCNGYIQLCIFAKRYLAHRISWFIVHGEWPDCIDHINGVRTDNRLINLRSVTNTENLKNACIQKNNTTGVRGVSFHSTRGVWIASIGSKCIGRFKTLEAAALARKAAEAAHGYHPNHGRPPL